MAKKQREKVSSGTGRLSRTVRDVLSGKLTWQYKVPRAKLIEHVVDGMTTYEIAQLYNVSHNYVAVLQRKLELDEIWYIINKKGKRFHGSAPPPVYRVKSVHSPIDLMEKAWEIVNDLDNMRAYMLSPEGIRAYKNVYAQTGMMLQITDRRMRALSLFAELHKTYSEQFGFEVWRKQILALVKELDPTLHDQLLMLIRERLLAGYREAGHMEQTLLRLNRGIESMQNGPVEAGALMQRESQRLSSDSGNGSVRTPEPSSPPQDSDG